MKENELPTSKNEQGQSVNTSGKNSTVEGGMVRRVCLTEQRNSSHSLNLLIFSMYSRLQQFGRPCSVGK